MSLHKKWSFPLRISLVNVTESAVSSDIEILTLIEKIVSKEGQKEIVLEKILTENLNAAEVFNKFFINIVANLTKSTDHGHWWPSYERHQ